VVEREADLAVVAKAAVVAVVGKAEVTAAVVAVVAKAEVTVG
jgi:hypothetical protein